MWRCPYCGRWEQQNARRCRQCGAPPAHAAPVVVNTSGAGAGSVLLGCLAGGGCAAAVLVGLTVLLFLLCAGLH